MQMIDARGLDHKAINQKLREAGDVCALQGCCGQRFIAAGMADKAITIEGVPGNALGAYLNGASITVCGNAQDAVGDTMNAGEIVVHGSIGDAAGYAMRGGRIFIRDSAGYRAGIHMKAYKDKIPLMVIGGAAGSFLGEYQAGGVIVVLGLHTDGRPLVGNFPCTGMHGGKLFLRGLLSGFQVENLHFERFQFSLRAFQFGILVAKLGFRVGEGLLRIGKRGIDAFQLRFQRGLFLGKLFGLASGLSQRVFKREVLVALFFEQRACARELGGVLRPFVVDVHDRRDGHHQQHQQDDQPDFMFALHTRAPSSRRNACTRVYSIIITQALPNRKP